MTDLARWVNLVVVERDNGHSDAKKRVAVQQGVSYEVVVKALHGARQHGLMEKAGKQGLQTAGLTDLGRNLVEGKHAIGTDST